MATSSKFALTQSLVLALAADQRPTAIEGGKWVTEPFIGREYSITDSHRDAPVGFGVRVSKTGKSYTVQRKISGKLVRAKVGAVRDFANLGVARDAARELVARMQVVGGNPHKAARKEMEQVEALTVGGALRAYRDHLVSRAVPASRNTLTSFDKQTSRFDDWSERPIGDLTTQEVLARFDEVAAKTRTSAEHAFRMLGTAIRLVIKREKLDANARGRPVRLAGSALDILTIEQRYRSRAALEADILRNQSRNPLTGADLPALIRALWAGRESNPTGTDFMLLCLLWGVRRGEAAALKWGDAVGLSPDDAVVYMASGRVDIPITKNKRPHSIPLTRVAKAILMLRLADRAHLATDRRVWVFPARHPASISGHYETPAAMMQTVLKAAGIARMNRHDARRTFATVAEYDVGLSRGVVKRMLNHAPVEVTDKYQKLEFEELRSRWQLVENYMLKDCPEIVRSLGLEGS
jgi:integrase